MDRTTWPAALVLVAVVLWCGGTALAFTLQFGNGAGFEASDTAQGTTGADVPTPQLFRVVFGPDVVSHGTASASAGAPTVAPAIRFHVVPAPHPTPAESTRPRPDLGPARLLSGVEIFLLRQAHTVAEGQNQPAPQTDGGPTRQPELPMTVGR